MYCMLINKSNIFFQIGRTERIKNNLNPNFTKKINIDYFFEEVQLLKFAVYDIDNETVELGDDDFLGETQTTLGQVHYIQIVTLNLKKNVKLNHKKVQENAHYNMHFLDYDVH